MVGLLVATAVHLKGAVQQVGKETRGCASSQQGIEDA